MMSSVDDRRIGRAFSIHTFTGNTGSAIAPMMIAYLASLWHWKVALMLVAAFGIFVALAVASQVNILRDRVKGEKKPKNELKQPPIRSMRANVRLLMTSSVLILFAFYPGNNDGNQRPSNILDLHAGRITRHIQDDSKHRIDDFSDCVSNWAY